VDERIELTDSEVLINSMGTLFTVLNFENGLGVISLSAYWQSVIRGLMLLAVVVLQATGMQRRHRHAT